MKVTIHQPDFLPWLGFFHRWAQSDIYIIYDDVQFIKGGWHNRDKINTPNRVIWLTVPVITKGKGHQLIRDVKIANQHNWREKHLKSIRQAYSKSKNFAYYFDTLQETYNKNHKYLIDLNVDLLEFAARDLGIFVPTVFSSEYKLQTKNTERLVDLMIAVSGTIYITGSGSKDYLQTELFEKQNIDVIFQDTEDIKNNYNTNSVGLSILDYFFTKQKK